MNLTYFVVHVKLYTFFYMFGIKTPYTNTATKKIVFPEEITQVQK